VIVIGVVGKQSSGKDVLVDYLCRKHGFKKLSTGDIIRTLAHERGMETTRENLQHVASELISKRSPEYITDLLLRKIDEAKWDRVGITGIRTPSDVHNLRNNLGDSFTLVFVSVGDPKLRFQRATERGKPRDTGSYKDFLGMDQRENELFQLEQTLAMADVIIENDGSLEDYRQRVEALFQRLVQKERM
jgi:dephospho-CoA kinase